MPRDNSTNPWGDVGNQVVGAIYKHYMSQPTAADRIKAQLQQAQLNDLEQKSPYEIDKLRIDNEMGQRQLDQPWMVEGAPASAIEDMYGKYLPRDEADIYNRRQNPLQQLDLGATKAYADPVTGGIVTEYGMGLGPDRNYNKDTGQVIESPAFPSQVRPSVPQQPTMTPQMSPQPRGFADILGDILGEQPPVGGAQMPSLPNTSAPKPGAVDMTMDGANFTQLDERTAAGLFDGTIDPEDPALLANQSATAPVISQSPAFEPPVVQGLSSQVTMLPDGTRITTLPKTGDVLTNENDKNFSQIKKNDSLNDTISSAMYNIANGGAGLGSYMKDIPFVGGQTTASNLEADLSKITNTAALDEIARLKEESKTGGFFGNLSDGERQAVADSQLAIRQTMNPQELAYRLAMHQDLVNDIVHGRGKQVPGTNQMIPFDAGAPRSGLPTLGDIQNAQSPEELTQMWDAFDKYPAFKGQPPKVIEDALVQRVNQMRGGQ